MTVSEMHTGVDLGVQKVNSNAFDSLIPEEVNYYLNKAQREYIRRQNVYLKKSLNDLSRPDKIRSTEAFENLASLLISQVIESTDISDATGFDNAKVISLSNLDNDLFQYAYGQAKTSPSSKWRACKPIIPSDIHTYTEAEYNDPIFRTCPLLITGSNVLLFYDSNSQDITDLLLMYIKEPAKMVKDSPSSGETDVCELPVNTHDEVVDIAVSMILGDFKSAAPEKLEQSTVKEEV